VEEGRARTSSSKSTLTVCPTDKFKNYRLLHLYGISCAKPRAFIDDSADMDYIPGKLFWPIHCLCVWGTRWNAGAMTKHWCKGNHERNKRPQIKHDVKEGKQNTHTHKSQRVYKDKRIRNISKKERKTHVMCQAWLFLFCFRLNGLYEEILFFVFTYKQNKKTWKKKKGEACQFRDRFRCRNGDKRVRRRKTI
jgi:hypothetical protein